MANRKPMPPRRPAEPPRPTGKSEGAGPPKAPAKARPDARAKQAAPKPRGPGMAGTATVVSCLILLGAFALPTCVLVVIGMVPTFVAAFVDTHPRRMLALTIGPLNLAGTAPFALKLWAGAHTMAYVTLILSNPLTWMSIYTAAGVGWLLYLGMPLVTRFAMERGIESRKARILAMQANLLVEWGHEVDSSRDFHQNDAETVE